MYKYLGIDFGLKRIGLSITDQEKIFAFPLTTIKYDNAFNSVMDELGLKANVSRMYPGAGWPDDMEAHFFNLAYFPSMAERGKIVDSLWSGKFDGLSGISEVISCGRQSVLAGTFVGGSSAQ